MASQDVSGKTSKLAQMQMRYQQRQQQEKEQKRLELNESKTEKETDLARSALKTAKPNNIGNGKLRPMLDERRRGAGIDRSNPLKPITVPPKATPTPQSEKPIKSRVHGVRSSETVTIQQASSRKTIANKQAPQSRSHRSLISPESIGERNNNAFSGGIDNVDDLDSETMPHGFLADGDTINGDSNNNNDKKSILNGKRTPTGNKIKLNPVLTKKTPSARTPTAATSHPQTPTSAKSNSTAAQSAKPQATAPAMKGSKKATPEKIKAPPAVNTATTPTAEKSTPRLPAGDMNSPESEAIASGPPPEGMVACKICGRNFIADRVAKHEVVCEKMSKLKRKVYDASKHRIQGTEVEQYFRKKPATRGGGRKSANYASAQASSQKEVAAKNNNWRLQHQEFISAIRAAKQVQAHLARGGKLSDLPPPPPSINPDYVQCPHCNRRFNKSAAERHIPKCSTMLHNKTKPQKR